MSRFRLARGYWATVALLTVLAPVILFGCNKKTAGGANKLQVYTSSAWEDLEVNSLAYIELGSSIADVVAEQAAARIIEGELRGSQDRFILLSSNNVANRADKAGKNDLLTRVRSVWKSDRKVDQFLAVELSEALGVDGLAFADLTDWTEDRVDASQEGTSWSRVGVGLYLYSGETGLLVWGADRALREDSIPYNPAPSAAGGEPGADERAERSLNRADSTPEPPEIEGVARAVLAELISAFPPRK